MEVFLLSMYVFLLNMIFKRNINCMHRSGTVVRFVAKLTVTSGMTDTLQYLTASYNTLQYISFNTVQYVTAWYVYDIILQYMSYSTLQHLAYILYSTL